MSTKKIAAGDTLTVGDLTDDHLGAVIEVGEPEGIRYRLTLGSVDAGAAFMRLVTKRGDERREFSRIDPVTVIAPPPVVQPDEPTELGQCIRIEGHGEWWAVVAEPGDDGAPIRDAEGSWFDWDLVLLRAGDRQIIVSDPPRWPDETPDVPERIEAGEWPDHDDTHLREWEWIDYDDNSWRWHGADERDTEGWRRGKRGLSYAIPFNGPFTRGECVE